MKARIKKTGEVVNIAPYARVELDVCDSRGNPITKEFEEVELVQDNDWKSFRRDAAKDILCAIVQHDHLGKKEEGCKFKEAAVEIAIIFADELIKQLREQ